MRLFPGMTVVYLSSERFTNELINAIRYDRTAEFRARYRTIEVGAHRFRLNTSPRHHLLCPLAMRQSFGSTTAAWSPQ